MPKKLSPAARARGKRVARPKKSKPKPKLPRATAPSRLSAAQYARHRGVSREAVSKALREGRIHADSRGLIDQAVADKAWAANTTARSPAGVRAAAKSVDGYIPSIEGITLTDARTMHELTKARIAALQLAREMGELVSAATVRDQAFRAARAARDVLESIPDRISDTLAGMTDGDAIRKLLSGEIENALDALATADDLGDAAGPA